jgi:steroid delta-isomerase-like uncharacterized protein
MNEGYDASDNAAVVRRWFEEVWNRGREEAIDELFDEEGVAHGLADEAGAALRGPTGFKPFFRRFREAFPEMEVVVEDTVSEGDKVAARCTVRGRHRGDALGFKATDSPVEFDGICIVRVRGGKIVEAWNNFDFMSMFQQLGALRLDAGPNAPDQDDALPSLD